MALDALAQQIASKGRRGDSTLIHVNPAELQGLHALARSTGASSGLTVNPETGLYEAFSLKKFFKSVLPTILGTVANVVLPGSGLIVGALTGAATNKKNRLLGAVLGGMGASGGNALVAGLNSAGATALGTTQAAIEAGSADALQSAASAAAGVTGAPVTMANVGAGLSGLNPFGEAGMSAAGDNWSKLIGTSGTAPTATSPGTVASGLGGPTAAATQAAKMVGPAVMAGMEPEEEKPTGLSALDWANNPAAHDVKRRRYRYVVDPVPFDVNAPLTSEHMQSRGRYEELDDNGNPLVTAAAGGSVDAKGAYDFLKGKSTSPASQAAYAYLQGRGAAPAREQFTNSGPSAAEIAAAQARVRASFAKNSASSTAPAASTPVTKPVTPTVDNAYINGGDYSRGNDTLPPVDFVPDNAYVNGGDYSRGSDTLPVYVPPAPPPMTSPVAGEWVGWEPPREVYGAATGGAVDAGPVALQNGGFVFPADVVAIAGRGSSGAGLEVLAEKFGARPVQGKGHGQSDDVHALIDGRQPARVARDEAILDAEQVTRIGGGDPKRGAKKLYDMMTRVRKQATGSPKQMRPINLNSALR